MKLDEAKLLLYNLRKVFDIVRFVDVSMTVEVDITGEEFVSHEYNCYAVWNKAGRCENCISAKAFASKSRMTKYEFINNDVFYIVAKYIEVEGVGLVLEIVSKVTDEILFGALGKERIIENILKHNEKLYKDPLTGAYNRTYYEEQLKSLNMRSAVAMLDIDNFKQINDTYGHLAGDIVLKTLVAAIKENIRSSDILVRIGGDEFMIFFSNSGRSEIKPKLENLLEKIRKTEVPGYPEIKLTVSMGCTERDENDVNIFESVDKLLYLAKKQKDCLVYTPIKNNRNM